MPFGTWWSKDEAEVWYVNCTLKEVWRAQVYPNEDELRA